MTKNKGKTTMRAMEYKGYEIDKATIRVIKEYSFGFDDAGNIDYETESHDGNGEEGVWLISISKNGKSTELKFDEEPIINDIQEAIDKKVTMTKQKINPLFERLIAHVGHNIELVTYGDGEPVNVAIECVDCYEVLLDEEKYDEPE